MPRFFFHVHDGRSYPDEEGTELPTLAAARSHAVRYAGELLQAFPESFWTGEEWKMDVTDDRGLTLFCLMFVAIDAPSTMRPSRGDRRERD